MTLKSRVELALELAGYLPTNCTPEHSDAVRVLSAKLEDRDTRTASIALANVLLKLVALDEQAAAQPVAEPAPGSPRKGCPHGYRYLPECPECYLDIEPIDDPPPPPPPTSPPTMTYGGLCQCAHSRDHSVPHEPGCVGYRGPASPPVEDKRYKHQGVIIGPDRAGPHRIRLLSDDLHGEDRDLSGMQEAADAYRERDEAQAELTRLKEENARLSGELEKSSEREEERRYELRRQDAVVEAARVTLAKLENYFDEHGAVHDVDECPEDDTCDCQLVVELNAALRVLQEAISALDQPSRLEPSSEREIVVGSTWRRLSDDVTEVESIDHIGWIKCTDGYTRDPKKWHSQFAHVSNPEPPAEDSASGSEEPAVDG